MNDVVTLRGHLGTAPERRATSKGTLLTSFRLATQSRRFDRDSGRWIDAGTNWYTVTAWRQLGERAFEALAKGDRVIVVGNLRIRDYERSDGTTGRSVEIDADAIGPDLSQRAAQEQPAAPERPREAPPQAPAPELSTSPQSSNAAWAAPGTEPHSSVLVESESAVVPF